MSKGDIMARTPSGPYYYGMANRKGEKDRYVLCIRDQKMKSGYKQIVFHSSKREAGVKAKALYEDYLEKNQAKPATGDDKPETVESACRIFIKRRSEGRQVICQRHSISQVEGRFNNHFIPFFKKALLADVAVEDVTKYRNVLQDKGLADKTVQYCIDEAREFFDYCVEVGWLDHTPFDSTFKMARPKPKKNRIPGNIEDYRRMLMKGWSNPVNHAVALVCFFTGMRVSEIRALKKSDFEPYYGQPGTEDCVVLHIRRSLTEKNEEKSPKNGRERTTVLPRWVYDFISPVFLLSSTQLCFSNTHGKKPISIDKNLYQFRNALASVTGMTADEVKASGIDFHSLRKMFNSMMTGTLSSDIRRGILGWTSENVALEHYFQVLPVHYQKILDAQKVLFDQESVEWFRNHDILDLSDEYKTSRKRNKEE